MKADLQPNQFSVQYALVSINGESSNTVLLVVKKQQSHIRLIWAVKYGEGLDSCCHECKNEFPSLPGHFEGECKTVCPTTEAQRKLDEDNDLKAQE